MADQSILTFPCTVPVKIMGRATENFYAQICEIAKRHCSVLDDNAFSINTSREARFISITVMFVAESRAMIDAFYLEITQHPDVMMAL